MVWRLDLWGLFASPAFWWMDAMVLLWALFADRLRNQPFAHGHVAEISAA
jgi:hypothetical protein